MCKHSTTAEEADGTEAEPKDCDPKELTARIKISGAETYKPNREGDLLVLGGVGGTEDGLRGCVSIVAGVESATVATVDLDTARELRDELDTAIATAESSEEVARGD